MRNPNSMRPCVTMPVDADPKIYLTGSTDKPVAQRDDDIRIRFNGGPGFMPSWMFLWVLRTMRSPREAKTNDSRISKVSEDAYDFVAGPVTVNAKKFENRVAMKVTVVLREEPYVVCREIDSLTCVELEKRIADMRSALNRYDSSKELPEIADDESRWFESFDKKPAKAESAPVAVAPETAA